MGWLLKHPEVVYTDLEDGGVLLHLETKFYYSLNDVGQAIWRLLDSGVSVEELIQKVKADYEVEEWDASAGISKFLLELEREQLVIPHQEGTGVRSMGEDGSDRSTGAKGPIGKKKPFTEPELIKHDEPLHEVVMNPFDPQLPLAE